MKYGNDDNTNIILYIATTMDQPATFGARNKGDSTHVVRRQGIADTAFNHQLNDLIDDDHSSDDSDDEAPATKDQYFEFTNSYHIMRLIRMILYIQIIDIALDNPSLEMSVLFRICCRAVLFYSTRFYSRPFIDLAYVVQYFYVAIFNFILKLDIPKAPSASNVDITTDTSGRRLNANPYALISFYLFFPSKCTSFAYFMLYLHLSVVLVCLE